MAKYLAVGQTDLLSLFFAKLGDSKYFSPNILAQEILDYNKHYQLSFRQLKQAHHKSYATSFKIAKMIDAIYLKPDKSIQDGHKLINLNTEWIITKAAIKDILITQMVIETIERMANKQGVKELKLKNIHGVIY